jgi:hypothetical protein
MAAITTPTRLLNPAATWLAGALCLLLAGMAAGGPVAPDMDVSPPPAERVTASSLASVDQPTAQPTAAPDTTQRDSTQRDSTSARASAPRPQAVVLPMPPAVFTGAGLLGALAMLRAARSWRRILGI